MHEPRAANTHLRTCLRETPSLGRPQSFLLGDYSRPVPMPMQQQRGHTARPERVGCPKPLFAVLRQNSRTRLRAKLRPRPIPPPPPLFRCVALIPPHAANTVSLSLVRRGTPRCPSASKA